MSIIIISIVQRIATLRWEKCIARDFTLCPVHLSVLLHWPMCQCASRVGCLLRFCTVHCAAHCRLQTSDVSDCICSFIVPCIADFTSEIGRWNCFLHICIFVHLCICVLLHLYLCNCVLVYLQFILCSASHAAPLRWADGIVGKTDGSNRGGKTRKQNRFVQETTAGFSQTQHLRISSSSTSHKL